VSKPSVLISVLNWNNAKDTLSCLSSLSSEVTTDEFSVAIRVIDNGSVLDDYHELRAGAERVGVEVTRLDENVGFTGGHNRSIKMAIGNGFDYIWLLNNDAKVEPGCLKNLLQAMEADRQLGAVSPVIKPEDNGEPVAAWGGMHEWTTRKTVWFSSEAESIKVHIERPHEIFVAGTAILLRTAALAQVGGLDDRIFAYYDDSDIGVRLAKGGWRSRVIFDAAISHGWRTFEQLPKHVVYLLTRNELLFWYTHSPANNRFILRLKLINQAIYDAIRLSIRGLAPHSDGALLGIWDFLFHKYGRPDVGRKVPFVLGLACRMSAFMHKSKLKEFQSTLASKELSVTRSTV
jgi:GT2 family glycosyltransferase